MHLHARRWQRPADFKRKRWDFDAMVGENGFWGSWREGLGLDADGGRMIEKSLTLIGARLNAFGSTPDVFGLVHADLRLANLLVHGESLRIIDFDDCGFSWFLYDFATSLSFIEHEAVVPTLLRAWCRGYRRHLALSPEELALIPAFVVLRRIMLTAWLASHAEVPFAREVGAKFTAGTVRLAHRLERGEYLASQDF